MKKTIYIVLASLLSSAFTAQSTSGTIKGKLYDFETKESVPFAHAYVFKGSEKIGTVSDIDGNFTIKPLSPGTYNLEVTFVGLDTFRISGIQVNSDKITFLEDIYMTEGMLTTVDIIYQQILIDPEDTKIATIGAAEIQKLAVRRDISQIAKSLSSEITTSEDGNEIYFRGSRNGDVIYYVDGVKSTAKPLLPSSSIHSMRVYTGGVPAQYGDMMGGVIMVETKSYFDYYNIWKAQQEMAKKD